VLSILGCLICIGKTRSAKILQWDKQPEGMTQFLRVVYSTEESAAMVS